MMTLATKDYGRNSMIRVYPNPVQENLSFDLPDFFFPLEVVIYDISGRLIRSINYEEENNVKVGNLKPGVYIVKFISQDKSLQVKFIKK